MGEGIKEKPEWIIKYTVESKPYDIYFDVSDNYVIPIGEDGFLKQLLNEFGINAIYHSAIYKPEMETLFRSFLRGKSINNILELGTFKGITTALLANYCNKVTTVDDRPLAIASLIWGRFGVSEKIIPYKVKSNEEKVRLINNVDFDFAFIDDQHDYDGAKLDFEAVSKCGKVLFHDYWYDGSFTGIKKFVDELPQHEVTIREPFAYWERNGIRLP